MFTVTRARWAVESEDIITKWDNEEGKLVKIDAKDYDEFKNKYFENIDNLQKNGKIELKKEKFRQKLSNGEIVTKIRSQKQSEHIAGTKGRERRIEDDKKNERTPSSEFLYNVDVEKLIYENIGKGYIDFGNNREYPVEYFNAENIIGRVYDSMKGKYVGTHRIEIVYSSKGIHAYPVKEKKE